MPSDCERGSSSCLVGMGVVKEVLDVVLKVVPGVKAVAIGSSPLSGVVIWWKKGIVSGGGRLAHGELVVV